MTSVREVPSQAAVSVGTVSFIGGPFQIQQVVDRHRGAQAALADMDNARLEVLETASLTVSEGRAAAQRLFALPPDRRPTAVFCANDLLAIGVLQAAVHAHPPAVVYEPELNVRASSAGPTRAPASPRPDRRPSTSRPGE